MKKVFVLIAALFIGITEIYAQNTVMVGGEVMYPSKNIIENAVNSQDHTTLVAAVKAAGLVNTLKGEGPFTVLAPTNTAFDKLPDGTLETLLKEENKERLTKILTYHVVPGTYNYKTLKRAIEEGNGETNLNTVSGHNLTLMMNGDVNIIVKDEKGNTSTITTYDVNQSNGVIHVIDSVLLPSKKMQDTMGKMN